MAESMKWIRRNPDGEIQVGDRVLVEGDFIRFPGDRDSSRIVFVQGKGLCCVTESGMFKINQPMSMFVGFRAAVTFEYNPQKKLPGVE